MSESKYTFVNFSLSGVLEDTDGTNRQVLLRRIKYGNKPFQDSGSLNVQLKPSTYKGKPSVDCFVNDVLIGYVAQRGKAKEILDAMEKKGAVISGFCITGGGLRNSESHYYGADLAVRYENE